jgi:uncharacterized protein (UPF0179 family)
LEQGYEEKCKTCKCRRTCVTLAFLGERIKIAKEEENRKDV